MPTSFPILHTFLHVTNLFQSGWQTFRQRGLRPSSLIQHRGSSKMTVSTYALLVGRLCWAPALRGVVAAATRTGVTPLPNSTARKTNNCPRYPPTASPRQCCHLQATADIQITACHTTAGISSRPTQPPTRSETEMSTGQGAVAVLCCWKGLLIDWVKVLRPSQSLGLVLKS